MRKSVVYAAMAAALLAAVPAFARPVPEAGITYEEMAEVLSKAGLPATIDKDSNGARIVKSSVNGVNFDVYFYQCNQGRCGDIQFAAGWSNAKVAPARVNEWNRTKRFLRVYWKPGNIIFAEHDARIQSGTTENIEASLGFWKVMLGEFKTFMKLN